MKNRILALIVLTAACCAPVFAASPVVSKSGAPSVSKAKANALQWDHRRYIRLCALPGAKSCTVAAIPPGIKNRDIINIIRTRVVTGAKYDLAIMSRRGVYLCASGIGGNVKLLCQKMPVPPRDSSVAMSAPLPDVAAATAAHLQNTVSLLTSRGMAAPVNRTSMNLIAAPVNRTANLVGAEGGCGYDEETGEVTCEGGGGGGTDPDPGSGGSEEGPYTDVPDPGDPSNDPGNAGSTEAEAEAIAGPYISEMITDTNTAFYGSGFEFKPNQDQCNVVIARCRDDCGDRTGALYGMCTIVAGMIAAPPPWAAKIAGGIFALACYYNVMNRGSQCKQECVFDVIPCG